MIRYCNNNHDIISLWADVFGDSEEEILYFIKNLAHGKCLGYFENNKLVSMFFLVDCCINHKNYKYIYAACTYKEYEGRGFMTKLIEYAYKNDSSLCLIPANESLIKFYKKRGFNKSSEIDSLKFDELDDIKEYLFEGFELKDPIVMVKE
ncbi:MAG: GNAT family N-acetyltransferase [Eubacterium sp.]|nr:GNAT family N-acetyltransferase [Eubacterium sp.]